MAVAFVRNHQIFSSKTSGTTFNLVISSTNASVAGNTLVAFFLFDNTSSVAPTVQSLPTGPAGETGSWQQVAYFDSSTATAGSGVRGEVWAITTTVSWPAGFSNAADITTTVATRALLLVEFSGVTTTRRGTNAQGTSTSGVPTATTSGTAPAAGDLVLGYGGFETGTAPTADSDTLNGSWSAASTFGTTGGSSTTNIQGIYQYKVITAGGNQTYNPTGSSDSGACVAALVPLITADLSDNAGLNDSTASARTLGLDVTDATNAWDGTNLLDPVTASFEADDNADGLANGWQLLNGSGTTNWVLDPTTGTYSQEIVGPTTGPSAWYGSTTSFATNGGAWGISGDLNWVSGSTAPRLGVGNSSSATYISASTVGAWARISATLTPSWSGTLSAVLIVPQGTTVRYDSIRLVPGSLGTQTSFTTAPNVTTSLTSSGGLTLDVSDAAGLSDPAAKTVTLGRQDSTGLADPAARDVTLDRQDSADTGPTDTASLATTLARSDPAGLQDAAISSPLNVRDLAGLSDSVAFDVASSQVDSAGPADLAIIDDQANAAADQVGITDTISCAIGVDATDDAGAADTVAIVAAPAADDQDQVGLTDTTSTSLAWDRSDAASAGDSIATVTAETATATDQAGLTDSVTTAAAMDRAASDPAGLGDTASRLTGVDRQDPTGLGDGRTLVIGANVVDGTGVADSTGTSGSGGIGAADDASLFDGFSVTLQTELVESITTGDTATAGLGRAAGPSDNLGLGDSVELQLVHAYAASDGAGLADTLDFALAVGLDLSDRQVLSDLVTTLLIAGQVSADVRHPNLRVENGPREVAVGLPGAVVVEDNTSTVTVGLPGAVLLENPTRTVAVDPPATVAVQAGSRTVAVPAASAAGIEVRSGGVAVDSPGRSVDLTGPVGVVLE